MSDNDKKVSGHNHDKYITTQEFNNLAPGVFTGFFTQANLVTKTDFDTKKINSNKTEELLVENELKKIEKFDASYFRSKNYFDGDGMQNHLVFQPMYKYFKIVGNSINQISTWE